MAFRHSKKSLIPELPSTSAAIKLRIWRSFALFFGKLKLWIKILIYLILRTRSLFKKIMCNYPRNFKFYYHLQKSWYQSVRQKIVRIVSAYRRKCHAAHFISEIANTHMKIFIMTMKVTECVQSLSIIFYQLIRGLLKNRVMEHFIHFPNIEIKRKRTIVKNVHFINTKTIKAASKLHLVRQRNYYNKTAWCYLLI